MPGPTTGCSTPSTAAPSTPDSGPDPAFPEGDDHRSGRVRRQSSAARRARPLRERGPPTRVARRLRGGGRPSRHRPADRLRRHEARARTEAAPARLAAGCRVHYDEFSNLKNMIPVLPADGATLKLDVATATRWCDGLLVDDAQVVATYEHPHFSQWPAITTRDHERGRITCVGTIPDSSFAKSLFDWLATDVVQPWCEAAGHDDLDRRNGRRRNQAPIPAQLVLGSRLSIRAHRGARHSDWGDVPHPRSHPTRAVGCSGAC